MWSWRNLLGRKQVSHGAVGPDRAARTEEKVYWRNEVPVRFHPPAPGPGTLGQSDGPLSRTAVPCPSGSIPGDETPRRLATLHRWAGEKSEAPSLFTQTRPRKSRTAKSPGLGEASAEQSRGSKARLSDGQIKSSLHTYHEGRRLGQTPHSAWASVSAPVGWDVLQTRASRT